MMSLVAPDRNRVRGFWCRFGDGAAGDAKNGMVCRPLFVLIFAQDPFGTLMSTFPDDALAFSIRRV
jgi:hypothetical protein